MWYANDWKTSFSAVANLIGGILSMFGQTLSALMAEHIFAFFLAALLCAVAVGLCGLLYHTAKRGVQS